ncbi:uncharacterized protein LOC122310134 [Carya illinoinensis]|uniref:uncharacterized protein LOC122310134 n=1 Tax=Carya illinoinensis TaxID=32201 RepID=UPI001C71F9FB|nr:uncharacterized protein LOC122310134 [Carya illinoinensis]
MDEELAKQWEELSLTKKEKWEIILAFNSTTKAMQQSNFCLLAMIIAERPINRESFKITMSRVWRCNSWIQFSEIGSNKYLVEFHLEQDLQQVICGTPWSFDRWLVCLHLYEGNRSINEVPFTTEEFWMHAYNMPLASMTEDVGKKIGDTIGKSLIVQVDDRGIGWESF